VVIFKAQQVTISPSDVNSDNPEDKMWHILFFLLPYKAGLSCVIGYCLRSQKAYMEKTQIFL
jgi:hypothetical protein